tara:strand:+ start:868 stop:1194 length:327 start_codon:yes stop_codon:yes gene_type:complete
MNKKNKEKLRRYYQQSKSKARQEAARIQSKHDDYWDNIKSLGKDLGKSATKEAAQTAAATAVSGPLGIPLKLYHGVDTIKDAYKIYKGVRPAKKKRKRLRITDDEIKG